MRVLYKAVDGRITPCKADLTTPCRRSLFVLTPARLSPQRNQLTPVKRRPRLPQREPLRADLHPAAESEESMERELFSQHIERNEYSNFKLRSETRAIEARCARSSSA